MDIQLPILMKFGYKFSQTKSSHYSVDTTHTPSRGMNRSERNIVFQIGDLKHLDEVSWGNILVKRLWVKPLGLLVPLRHYFV